MKLKITAILIVVLLLVTAVYVPVYAETTIPELPANGWEYWLVANIETQSGTYLYYLESHGPILAKSENDHGLVFNTYKWWRYIDNEWRIIKVGQGTMIMNVEYIEIYAANHNIAYRGGPGFFFLRPKVSPLLETMERTDFGTILSNVSAGLSPIVGLIVSVIAFRKACAFFRSQWQS